MKSLSLAVLRSLAVLVVLSAVVALAAPSDAPTPTQPLIKVVPSPEQTDYLQFRRMLVGPGLNQPKPYPGYEGFVGWAAIARTRTGALIVTFSSGYWHASPPTEPESPTAEFAETFKKLSGLDISTIHAPRGGRAEIIRSEDGGLTWSRPEVMLDTPWDDRSPSAVGLSDGSLVASLFTYDWKAARTAIIRSFDDGKTWEQTPHYPEVPFKYSATDGPPLELPDKSLLLAVYGGDDRTKHEPEQNAILQSRDRGATWQCLGTIKAPYELSESSVARLRDGHLILITRPEGAVSWSSDGGHTWTEPVRLPVRMADPWLLTLRDGTLLCVHLSYNKEKRGLRAITSRDGGKTWLAAGPDYGFPIDPSVYGYSRGIELPDGSIMVVYQGTGGHKWDDARHMSIYALRLRVRKGGREIDVLPAPGSPAAGTKGQ